MWWYLGIAAVCAGMVPWARKRSEGSMTRYSVGTGAPIVFVFFGAAALVAAVAQRGGDSDLAREQLIQLVLAGITGVFCMVERGHATPKQATIAEAEPAAAEGSYVPWHR